MSKEIAVIAGTAVKLPTNLKSGWIGTASHYKLVPPIGDVEFVVASGVKQDLGMGFAIHECIVFVSNEAGDNNFASVAELRDTVCHAETFATIGYTILDSAPPVPVVVITAKDRQDVRDFVEGEFAIIRESKMLKG